MAAIYETVTQLVSEKFSTMQSLAQGMLSATEGLLGELGSVVPTVTFEGVDVSIPPITGGVINDPGVPADPTITSPSLTAPPQPTFNTPGDAATEMPEFTFEAPSVTLPDAPAISIGAAPSVPTVLSVDLPAEAVLDFAAPPTMSAISPPNAPTLNPPTRPSAAVPTFDTALTITDFDVSGIVAALTSAAQFLKSDLSAVMVTLLDFINNPRMAIGETLKDAMIARDRQKLADEYQVRISKVEESFEARGWSTPQGIERSEMFELEKQRYFAEDNILRDYTIKDFELSQQNMQQAMQVIPSYASTMVSLINSTLDNAIKAAQYAFEASINKYRAAIEVYKQDVEIYKVAYLAYEMEIKAQALLVDMFSAEVQAAKLQVEVNTQQVELYKAVVAVQAAKVDMYKTAVEGAVAKMSFSRTAIDMYKAQIEGYNARLSAETAKVQVYQGQLTGEEVRVKVFMAQAQAYASLVDAAKTKMMAEIENIRAANETNQSVARVYDSAINGYSASLQAASALNDSEVKAFMGRVSAYEAASRVAQAQAQILVQESEANARSAGLTAELQIKQAETQMHNTVVLAGIAADAMKGATNVAAQLTASAMSAVSAGAHLQASSAANETWTHND